MRHLLAFLLLVSGCSSCGPVLPPVVNCAPQSYRCNGNTPEVCSATRRWYPIGDRVCVHVCALTDTGVAYCAP
jgi:hypothetical protein